MKNKYLKGLALFSMVLASSCSDLEEAPYTDYTQEQFFTNDLAYISSLGSAYTKLYGYANHQGIFSLQEAASDAVVVPTRGGDWEDGGQWVRMHRHEYNASEGTFSGVWNFCFGGVSTCNRLIAQFEALNNDGSAAFIAELKVLRALYYYWLIDIYGNVPLVTTFDNEVPETKSRKEIYDFIEKDLKANVPLLTKNVDKTTYARMNYYVGQALLANLYINAEVYTGSAKWAEAKSACDEIINSGKYSLESNYFDNFKTNNAGSKENIFVIPYDEINATGFNLPQMTLHYLSQATYSLKNQPWNGYSAQAEFYHSFDEADKRKKSFIAGPQFDQAGNQLIDNDIAKSAVDADGPPLNFTPELNALTPNCERQAGARIGKFEFAIGADQSLSNDFPIFRYGDILLLKAEALWRVSAGSTDALDIVNDLRKRAGVDAFTELTNDNLLAERGREMCFEAKRRTDMIRFGKYNDAWWEKSASNASKNIMPIPSSQIKTNTKLKQNPGY